MTATPGEQLAEINHALALAQTNLKRAFSALQKYEEAMGIRATERKKPAIRCLAIWQKWLAENGPNTRQAVTDATDTKLTERATPYTVVWDDDIDPTDEEAYPDDTLFRIRALHGGEGRGAPPVVYFLWSQRWDVHPLFGVGPIFGTVRITDEQSDEDRLASALSPLPEPLEPEDDLHPYPESDTVSEETSDRFATLVDWYEAWAPLFDSMVASESKPTDEQKAMLQDSLPESEKDNLAALAVGYQEAVLRSRNPAPILGIIQPPPVSAHPIDPEHGEEVPIDWDEILPDEPEDKSTWEMVGSHNHLPHLFGPFCEMTACMRVG